jgi:hypothetical protein
MIEAPMKLIDDIRSSEREVAEFFRSLSPTEIALREGSAWTPAEHLDHLNIAVSAVARGIGTSRLLLLLRFGWARRGSRSFDQVREDYLARLAAGGVARGGFVPVVKDLDAEEAANRQHDLLARWQRVNGRLYARLAKWSEKDLDRIQLPHPLLGKITTREMVYFTIYHNHHHVVGAKRRLPRFAVSE